MYVWICQPRGIEKLMFWAPASLLSELIKARGLCIVCGFYTGTQSYTIGQREHGNMKNKNKLVEWKGLIDSRGECGFERKFLL